jgi:lipoyl(octanoyl) transferase
MPQKNYPIKVQHLGLTDFSEVCARMQAFTASRTETTPDEIWLTEHPPVYSFGLNKKNVRLPWRDDIPVVNCDRGGKITYHGPGQVIMYVLLDLKRYGLNIRQLVNLLENSVITILKSHGIKAEAKKDAPGVYVNEAKIAALGLRLKKDYCYHGLSLNVEMDLTPFSFIDPCGYAGLETTQLKTIGIQETTENIANQLVNIFQAQLVAHATYQNH